MSAEFFSQFSLVFPFISLINLNRIICLKALIAFGMIILLQKSIDFDRLEFDSRRSANG